MGARHCTSPPVGGAGGGRRWAWYNYTAVIKESFLSRSWREVSFIVMLFIIIAVVKIVVIIIVVITKYDCCCYDYFFHYCCHYCYYQYVNVLLIDCTNMYALTHLFHMIFRNSHSRYSSIVNRKSRGYVYFYLLCDLLLLFFSLCYPCY